MTIKLITLSTLLLFGWALVRTGNLGQLGDRWKRPEPKASSAPSQGAFHDAGLSACQTLDGKHQSATRAAANR